MLDIDNDVLKAAKDIAAAKKQTAGQVISDLARRGLVANPSSRKARKPVLQDGWYVLPSDGGVVTPEIVQQLLDEADLEDAGIKPY